MILILKTGLDSRRNTGLVHRVTMSSENANMELTFF